MTNGEKIFKNQHSKLNNKSIPQRSANIELLRIVATLFVLSLHYNTFGEVRENVHGVNIIISRLIDSFSYCAVDIFVLISGWFYGKQTKITLSKSAEKMSFLWLKTFIYIVLIMVFEMILFKVTPNKTTVLSAVFHVTNQSNWYVTMFMFLLLFKPFLDKLINCVTTKEHFLFVISIFLFVCIPATVCNSVDPKEGYSIFWLVCLYLIGAFLRKVFNKSEKSKYFFLLGFIVFCLSIIIIFFGIESVFDKLHWSGKNYQNVFKYTSVPVLGSAICLLEFFARVDIKSNKISKVICKLSSVTFDVFVIHIYGQLHNFTFKLLLHTEKYYNSPYMILHFIISVLALYIVCTLITLLVSKFINKPFRKMSKAFGELISKTEIKILSLDIKNRI